MRGRAALAPLLALAAALWLAACGGGGDGSTSAASKLATVVPANAPLFVEGAVRPQGDLESALRTALGRLLGTPDPGAKIVAGFDRLNRDHGITFERDLRPWLGERAGVFYQSFRGDPIGVAETTDAKAALQSLRRAATADGHAPHTARYRGVTIQEGGRDSFATVGGLVVTGPRSGVEAAIDASKGSSLADSASYRSTVEDVPSENVFTAWADPRRVLGELAREGQLPAGVVPQVRSQFGALATQPVALWGEASPSYLALEASAGSSPATPAQQPSPLLSRLPSDSWLAFAVHETAAQVRRTLGAFGFGASAAPLRPLAQLGLDPATLSRWVGDVSGFLHGQSILGLGGALVVGTRDQHASLRTLRGIESVLRGDRDLVVERATIGGAPGFTVTPRGTPIQFVVTQKDGKVIAGIGVDSVTAALKPPRTLAQSSAFEAATNALGDGISPELYVDFQPLARLLAIPGMISDPDFKDVKPYLDRIDYLVAGVGQSAGRGLLRIALGVRVGSGGSGSGSVSATGLPSYAAIQP